MMKTKDGQFVTIAESGNWTGMMGEIIHGTTYRNKPYISINSVKKGFDAVYGQKAGFITIKTIAAILISSRNCSFTFASKPLYSIKMSLAFSKKFAHKKFFNHRILRLKDLGLLHFLYNRYVSMWQDCDENNLFYPISFAQMLGPIVLFTSGVMLSIVIGLLEIGLLANKKLNKFGLKKIETNNTTSEYLTQINMASSMEGPLSKWTNVMKGWQFRWFVLDDNAGLLSYYTSKEKMMRGVRRGCVRLKDAVLGIDDDDDSTFTITVDGKMFHFQARDPDERDRWINSLEGTILRHAQFNHKRWKPHQAVPTVHDFDIKLTETDAYLQILIDQVKNIETRLEKCENEEERNRCLDIRNTANEMLDSIKHTIVFLQIAKNTAHPVNGIYPGKSNYPTVLSTSSELIRTHIYPRTISESSPLDADVETGIEPALECCEEGSSHPTKPLPTIGSNWPALQPSSQRIIAGSESAKSGSHIETNFSPSHLVLPIPETSYSSSEDEDYYDAQNDSYDSIGNAARPQSPSILTSAFEDAIETLPSSLHVQNETNSLLLMANKIDYDAIYEDDDEDDLGSVESHGSVISHLLSQVKLGMDLTKVVLPTFILERRSLLEMYADFFAHPDLFVSITNFPDPKERMIQVVRWYLSAFHAGRKSSIAKKPFNPILGEIFRCHWDVTGANNASDSDSPVADGPLPWVSKNQLAFLAEQVSHHPPISAFYAEHYNKRISFSAHIWTKSKFLGLSIGVHMIGQGCVSVQDYDEEYIVTFPNGYGRSILTVPWVELGGTTNISCTKTGYSATVNFLTKPFYGGKKHRISADVFQPNDKKPFLTVAGEWNGCMNAKWADGRSEEFVDTKKLEIIKKIVRPVTSQEPMESRRLWKDVSAGLKLRNISRATEAKFQIEQRQRGEAKERKDSGAIWETKHFHENGENWIYDTPLSKRIVEMPNKT
uniref:Oxysterol-binding protein n=1 Tax=Strigamia maritima TaxID=126957 RepID=T1IK17_STRMM